MKISFFYDHVLEAAAQSGKTTGEVMALCRQAGITGIEINGQYLQENQDRIRRELEENKMQISCIYQQYEFGQNTDLTAARETVLLWRSFIHRGFSPSPDFLQSRMRMTLSAGRIPSHIQNSIWMRIRRFRG